MTSFLRPDEQAAQSDIEQSKRFDQKIKSGLSTAANIGLGITGIGLATKSLSPLASKIIPFINKHIPADMALKGISKVSPEIGALLNKGMKQGLSIKDGLDFLKDQFQEKKQEPAKENRNIIEQESPELHKFIIDEIKNGRSPIQAGALAYNNKKFMQAINKLKNSHKLNWGSIVENIYGKGDLAQKQQSSTESMESKMAKFNDPTSLAQEVMNPPGSTPTRPPSAEMQAAMHPQAQQSPQQSGMGQGQQALMEILKKIQASRGAGG